MCVSQWKMIWAATMTLWQKRNKGGKLEQTGTLGQKNILGKYWSRYEDDDDDDDDDDGA